MFQTNMFQSHRIFEMTQKTSSESELGKLRDDDYETKSGTETMDAPSGDDNDPTQRPNKKKRYHRHTPRQIQEMETFFKECPHPDDKQRKELSKELGLEPLQVKFWFQNKRTQMKAQNERSENSILKAENEKLRLENSRYKEALSSATCPNCGGPAALGEMLFNEQHLRMENVRLREEIDRISGVPEKFVGKEMSSFYNISSQSSYGGEIYGATDFLRSISGPIQPDKPMIIELAVPAMEELMRMAQSGDPLWVTGENGLEMLNEEEYFKTFPRGIGSKLLGLRSEASRQTAVVIMNPVSLVEILMDVNQWSTVFCGIVSKAMTLEVLSTGVAGNYNGALQLMTAEFQVPSPLVPTRDNYFVRYCKQHTEGTWAVVDVSLDNFQSSVPRSRRRPSGCLIQELPNGYSKVTWIEHVEADDRSVHNMYRSLVNNGLAFGAKRWVATLDRQCERLASSMAVNIPQSDLCVVTSPEGRKSMLKLAQKMMTNFFSGVGSSTAQSWTLLSTGSDDVRVMTKKTGDEPGRSPGIVLSVATSFWMPIPPRQVFDFLRDEHHRSEWDIFSYGGQVQEMTHIANGRDPGNCVSLLRVNSANSGQSAMLILQESCTDSTGSYVIYAPVDLASMHVVLDGGDPDYGSLLPSGYAILPDGPAYESGGILGAGSGGSLLTVAFQILVDSAPTAKLSLGSVATVNDLIKCTVEKIKGAVMCEGS